MVVEPPDPRRIEGVGVVLAMHLPSAGGRIEVEKVHRGLDVAEGRYLEPPEAHRPVRHDAMVARWENRGMPGKKRAKRAKDPLAAYRSIRKPMPPPEKVVPDKRKKIEEKEAERELREGS